MGKHSDLEDGGGQVQTKYDKVAKGYDYYGPAVNAAARIEALGFGGQTLMSSEVYTQLSEETKDKSLLHVVGGLRLKGIEEEVYIYQCLPRELKGRTFRGVFRRRDSEGGSVAGDSDLDFMVTRGASILIGSSFLESEDLTGDIMTLSPVQLQGVVSRLRKKIQILEQSAEANGDDMSACSDLETDLSPGAPIAKKKRRTSLSSTRSSLSGSVGSDGGVNISPVTPVHKKKEETGLRVSFSDDRQPES